ncbi:deoxyribonuclease V [candidate division TA06 bacterium]|nr:deoxyribonuclease V [candidate division TA06 bacterium]
MRPVITHPWKVSTEEGVRIQEELRSGIRFQNGFGEISTIAGLDVSFNRKRGYGAVMIFTFPDLQMIEEVVVEKDLDFPYVPGFLSFREGPILLNALEKIHKDPDILLIDGQGVAHPRGLGLASHIGLLLDKPTIGCAKSRLVGEYEEPDRVMGSVTPLTLKQKRIGSVVRTRNSVKPLFISPGHKIDLETSVEIVLKCCRGYRLPEPIRSADHASRKAKNTAVIG